MVYYLSELMKRTLFLLPSFGLFTLVLAGCSPPSFLPTPAGQQDPHSPFSSAAQPGSIWRSDDGGKTFSPKVFVDEKHKITKADILSMSFLTRADQAKAREIHRTPDVFVGTVDDMIFRTEDGAENWQPVNFPPKKVYSFIASRRSIDRMYATGVVADRAKIFRTVDGGENWQEVYSEPGTGTIIVSLEEDPKDVNVLFAGTSTGTVIKSADGGDTWKNVGANVSGPITRIVFDAVEQNTMYLLAFSSALYISRDFGESWNTASAAQGGPPGSQSVTTVSLPTQGLAFLISDPSISGTLYAGTQSGFFRSTDFAKTWEKVNIIESAEKFPIRSFAVNPKNSNEIVFVAGSAFYKSVNRGETWSVQQLSVDRAVSVIAYDPYVPEVIYLGLRKMK